MAQFVLILNFAARNGKPSLEREYGGVVYAMGVPAVILGMLFLVANQPWYVVTAPFLYWVWAAFGYYVDRYRPIEWRTPPRWSVFVPYVGLFVASQFSFWIPLWVVGLAYWMAYAALYSVNTGLNIYSHRRSKG